MHFLFCFFYSIMAILLKPRGDDQWAIATLLLSHFLTFSLSHGEQLHISHTSQFDRDYHFYSENAFTNGSSSLKPTNPIFSIRNRVQL